MVVVVRGGGVVVRDGSWIERGEIACRDDMKNYQATIRSREQRQQQYRHVHHHHHDDHQQQA
jgi:hypothetical protein